MVLIQMVSRRSMKTFSLCASVISSDLLRDLHFGSSELGGRRGVCMCEIGKR